MARAVADPVSHAVVFAAWAGSILEYALPPRRHGAYADFTTYVGQYFSCLRLSDQSKERLSDLAVRLRLAGGSATIAEYPELSRDEWIASLEDE